MSRFFQFAIFIAVVILAVGGIHYYFWARLIRDPGLPDPWRQAAFWTLLALALSMPLSFLLLRLLPLPVARVVLFLPYLWMGMMFLLFFYLLGTDLIRLVAWLALKVSGHGDLLEEAGRQVFLARLVAGAGLGLASILVIVSIPAALAKPTVKRIEVELFSLPKPFDGFTIAQLTDLHLGPTLGRSWLEDVVDRTKELKPDLVALTGDLVDGSVEQLLPELEPLKGLRAPGGQFFVTGNHEFFMDVEAWLPAITGLGFRVLDNERVAIERGGESIVLAGIHDPDGSRLSDRFKPDLGKALAGRDPSKVVILLAHQARSVREAEKYKVALQLSGHNHGGQIWPWRYFVYLQQPFVDGLHSFGDTQVYVSQGAGFWGPPMRLGTTAEITLVTLRSRE